MNQLNNCQYALIASNPCTALMIEELISGDSSQLRDFSNKVLCQLAVKREKRVKMRKKGG